jgi:hypothetical protein
LNAQRTAKGPISISECCVDGEYIIIENTSKRHDVNMTNWVLTHCVGSVRKVSFKFPENFIVKSKQRVKLWAGNKSSISNNHNNSNKKYNDLTISTNNTTLTSSTLCKSPTLNGKNGSKMNGHNHVNGNHTNSHNIKETLSPLLSFSTDMNTSLSDINECIENELILYDIENWTCGAQEMFIRLENEFGEEKALFRKTN